MPKANTTIKGKGKARVLTSNKALKNSLRKKKKKKRRRLTEEMERMGEKNKEMSPKKQAKS